MGTKLTPEEREEWLFRMGNKDCCNRLQISFLYAVIGAAMWGVSYFLTKQNPWYNWLYAALAILGLIDLFMCVESRGARVMIFKYQKWTRIYFLASMALAILFNVSGLYLGHSQLIFTLFMTLMVTCVHLPLIEKILYVFLAWLINYIALWIFLPQHPTTTYTGIYVLYMLLTIVWAYQLYRNSVTTMRAEHSKQISSTTDTLTGIGNRLASNHKLEELLAVAAPFTIAFIDLDNLKYCNDTYGHNEGDVYLIEACKVLQSILHNGEFLYRLGGDEFLLVSTTDDDRQLLERLERLRNEFWDMTISDKEYSHSFSYGCAYMHSNSNKTYSELLSEADAKMYQYKMRHSQHWEFGDEKKDSRSQGKVKKISHVNKAGLDSRVFDVLAATSHSRYLYLMNMNTNITRWSSNAVEYFSLPGEYIYDAGTIWGQRVHEEDRDFYQQDVNDVLSGKKDYHNLQYRVKNRDGHYVIVTCEGKVLKGENGEPNYFAGTITNHGIIDTIDPVTNLYNLYEFNTTLRRYTEAKQPVGILMVAINNFNTINTSYDYAFGNRLLQAFADKLRALVSGRGIVFRMDGAKFAILSQAMHDQKTIQTLYSEIVYIAQNNVYVDDSHIGFMLSGGGLCFDAITQDVDTILSELAYATETSKKAKNGELIFYNNSMWLNDRSHLELIADIKQSILNGCEGFYLNYQPQVNADEKIVGAEALLRWRNEKWGIVPPGHYIPVLENDSCFYELGLWILRTALNQVKPYLEIDPDFVISVNVSYHQLDHSGFRDDLLNILHETDFPHKNLTLELTEHSRTADIATLQENLMFFQSQGLRISADDFGTGYSSLSLLRDLPFSCVKIDQSFVFHLLENESDRILVSTIIECAKQFHIQICVEGVESDGVWNLLKTYTPDYYQGYHFSKPLSWENFLEYAKEHSDKMPGQIESKSEDSDTE